MDIVKSANLAAAFVLELCMLAALVYWGFTTGKGPIEKIGLGIGVPLLVVVVWGLFVAPKATFPAPGSLHLALQAIIFGLAALALARAGHPVLASAFALAVILNGVLVQVWQQ